MVVVGMVFLSASHGNGSGWYGFCLLVMVMVVVGMVFVC